MQYVMSYNRIAYSLVPVNLHRAVVPAVIIFVVVVRPSNTSRIIAIIFLKIGPTTRYGPVLADVLLVLKFTIGVTTCFCITS